MAFDLISFISTTLLGLIIYDSPFFAAWIISIIIGYRVVKSKTKNLFIFKVFAYLSAFVISVFLSITSIHSFFSNAGHIQIVLINLAGTPLILIVIFIQLILTIVGYFISKKENVNMGKIIFLLIAVEILAFIATLFWNVIVNILS